MLSKTGSRILTICLKQTDVSASDNRTQLHWPKYLKAQTIDIDITVIYAQFSAHKFDRQWPRLFYPLAAF